MGVLGVLNIDAAIVSVERAVAGHTGRTDAVKSVATILGAVKQVNRLLAHAKKMARFVFR